MSTALRIAAVTQVLKDLLNDGLINNDVSGITQNNITVSSLPPDRIRTDSDTESSQLNIFMYHATYNQGWRNVAQPSFNSQGDRITNPLLALDLHYLLTAYGASELHTDILLGMGMQFFHETPVLGRDQIIRATGSVQVDNPADGIPDSMRFLSRASLAEQTEQIKISPEGLSIEDISKLWAAFGAKYRPTAAYKVTVVLIESEKTVKQGLPVKERKIYVEPFKIPVIEKILSRSAPGQPVMENQKILNGYVLVVKGMALMNETVEVSIDGITIDKAASGLEVRNKEIVFTLQDQLPAGIHELKAIHPVLMGSPPVPHRGVESKSILFTLSPAILGNPTVSNKIINANGTVSATVLITLEPMVQPGQRVQLLLNEFNTTGTPKSYTFTMASSAFGSPGQPIANILVDIANVNPGTYLIRIQVDGAETQLDIDNNQKYISPSIDL